MTGGSGGLSAHGETSQRAKHAPAEVRPDSQTCPSSMWLTADRFLVRLKRRPLTRSSHCALVSIREVATRPGHLTAVYDFDSGPTRSDRKPRTCQGIEC